MKRHILTCTCNKYQFDGCNDSDDNDNQNFSTPVPSIPVNNIDNPVLATPVAYTKTDVVIAGESVVMTYKMLEINNKETQATALVFTPEGTPLAKG